MASTNALKESIYLLKFQDIKRIAKPLLSLLLELPLESYDAIVPVMNSIKQRFSAAIAGCGRRHNYRCDSE